MVVCFIQFIVIKKYHRPVFLWSKLDLFPKVLESWACVGAEDGRKPTEFPGGSGRLCECLQSFLSMLDK